MKTLSVFLLITLFTQVACYSGDKVIKDQTKQPSSIIDNDCYQVWMGLHCLPQNAATEMAKWSNTASKLQGINVNFGVFRPSEGTPSWGLKGCTKADHIKIISYITNGKMQGIVEIPRSAVNSTYMPTRPSIEEYLPKKIAEGTTYGFKVKSIMFYDNATPVEGYPDKPLFNWTSQEIQQMRDWLDANGHAEVKLMYNARNNSQAVMAKCRHMAVDEIMLEAHPVLWYNNAGSRQQLLSELNSNTMTKNKGLYFQITTNNYSPFGNPSQYQQVRRFVVWLGQKYGIEFLRNNRIVLLPVTYNDTTFTFLPELSDSGNYNNTLSSICLSLIEQRALFAGYNGTPTDQQADSYLRNAE